MGRSAGIQELLCPAIPGLFATCLSGYSRQSGTPWALTCFLLGRQQQYPHALECPIMPSKNCCRRSKCVSNISQEIDRALRHRVASPLESLPRLKPPIFDSVTIHALVAAAIVDQGEMILLLRNGGQ